MGICHIYSVSRKICKRLILVEQLYSILHSCQEHNIIYAKETRNHVYMGLTGVMYVKETRNHVYMGVVSRSFWDPFFAAQSRDRNIKGKTP